MRAADPAPAGIITAYDTGLRTEPSGARHCAELSMKNAAGDEIGKTYWDGEKPKI